MGVRLRWRLPHPNGRADLTQKFAPPGRAAKAREKGNGYLRTILRGKNVSVRPNSGWLSGSRPMSVERGWIGDPQPAWCGRLRQCGAILICTVRALTAALPPNTNSGSLPTVIARESDRGSLSTSGRRRHNEC